MTRDEFLLLAESQLGHDDYALIERMVLRGLSPYTAASDVAELTGHPIPTLYERARRLFRQFLETTGQRSVEEIAEELTQHGVAHEVPGALLGALRRRIAPMRLRAITSVYLEDDENVHM